MKTLILGSSGFLGKTIYFKLKNTGHDVLGTYCKNQFNNELVNQDVFDVDGLLNLVDNYKPDAIIWTIMNHEWEEEIADKVLPILCQAIGDI